MILMYEITLYLPHKCHDDLKSAITSNLQLLKTHLGGDVVLGDYMSDNDALFFQCGHEDKRQIETPVRLGTLIDIILSQVNDTRAVWRKAGDLSIGHYNLKAREMMLLPVSSGVPISLTEKERDMVQCIYAQEGHEIDRDVLLQEVWGYGEAIETHTLETHIYRLRQKVESDPSSPKWLVTTERGYKLCL